MQPHIQPVGKLPCEQMARVFYCIEQFKYVFINLLSNFNYIKLLSDYSKTYAIYTECVVYLQF